ncbi:MAG: hypothetical protein J6C12_10850 [Lachnospiraceae bacterium]|nr:hypothetical protein [Lachnospiraceae bacterium]
MKKHALPTIIKGHSPMDDYRKIQSQIKYTVQYAPSDDPVEPDCKENLTGNKSYKFTYSLVINPLILTGIGIVISIAAGLIFSYDSFSELERKIFAILIILTCAAFGVSLLLSGLGSFIELRAEKKDREINISLDSKTWILDNGQVVISDEQNYRSIQQYDPKTRLPIADAPFKNLKIIQKVYSITRVDGRIIADADLRELYRKHPYTNEGITWNEEDDSGRIYYYCQRDIRDKVMWYENMYGRELLLQALNELKQD